MRKNLVFGAIMIFVFLSVRPHAAVQPSPKVYMILDVTVHDVETYRQYREKVAEIIRGCGGRYLIRSGNLSLDDNPASGIISLGGDWQPDRFIVLEFDSQEQIGRCFESEEYLAIAPLSATSSTARSILVNGYVRAE